MKTITVRVETYYGVTNIYPVCTKAKLFAQLAGTKTLTSETLQLIKELDYKVETVPELKSELHERQLPKPLKVRS